MTSHSCHDRSLLLYSRAHFAGSGPWWATANDADGFQFSQPRQNLAVWQPHSAGPNDSDNHQWQVWRARIWRHAGSAPHGPQRTVLNVNIKLVAAPIRRWVWFLVLARGRLRCEGLLWPITGQERGVHAACIVFVEARWKGSC